MTVSFSVSNRLSLPFYHGMANIFILLLLSFRDFRLDFSLDLFLGNKHFPLALFLRFRFYGRLVYHWFSFGRKISLHLSISTIACTSFEWKMSMNRTQSDFPHLNDSPNLFCDRERNAVRRAFIFFSLRNSMSNQSTSTDAWIDCKYAFNAAYLYCISVLTVW